MELKTANNLLLGSLKIVLFEKKQRLSSSLILKMTEIYIEHERTWAESGLNTRI